MTFATYRYISIPLTDLYIALYAGDHERGEVPAACVVNVQVWTLQQYSDHLQFLHGIDYV